MRLFLIGVITLALCQAAAARGNVSARIIWYGIYTVSKSREINDPRSPTGTRYRSTPEPAASNTDRIPGKQGLHFGFGYVLSGAPGTHVTVMQLYRFPPGGMPDIIRGGARSTLNRTRRVKVGKSLLMGWNFQDSPPEQILIGNWTFEVWRAHHKLLEQTFSVFSP